jgi:hypothetical protein
LRADLHERRKISRQDAKVKKRKGIAAKEHKERKKINEIISDRRVAENDSKHRNDRSVEKRLG